MSMIPINHYEHRCKRCGYYWISRKKDPIRCAGRRCGSPYWNRDYKQVKTNG